MLLTGAVQVSRDQDGGRGGVSQMITLSHIGDTHYEGHNYSGQTSTVLNFPSYFLNFNKKA